MQICSLNLGDNLTVSIGYCDLHQYGHCGESMVLGHIQSILDSPEWSQLRSKVVLALEAIAVSKNFREDGSYCYTPNSS